MNPIYKFQLSAIDEARPVNYYDKQPQIAQYDGKYILKSDGSLANSSVNVVSEFAITDTTKKYYANGRVGPSTTACFIAYYTSNGNFISYQFASTGTARIFNKELLTIPENCGKIRVQGYNDGNGTVYLPQLFIAESRAFPVYNDDLAKDFEKESGQEFFRAKLSGKLTFQSDDYTYIVSQAFDTQFVLEIFISYNAGRSWTSYWRGTFWKTDCEFDDDAQTVVVQPTVLDQYNDVISGLDKEFNLIDLAPQIIPVKADKRPMVQVYVPGQSVIGCFLSGMWWEQDCEAVSDTEMMDIGGGAQGKKLEYYYHFAINKGYTNIRLSGSMTPQLPANVSGVVSGQSGKYFDFYVDGVHYFRNTDTNFDVIGIYDPNTGAGWQNRMVNRELAGNYSVNIYPVSGTPATGDITLDIETIDVYSRFVCDTETINSVSTYPIPSDDLVENNRNYTRIVGYYFPNTISFSNRHTETPTKWGLYQPGEYYLEPYSIYQLEFFPVARNGWGYVSVWFSFDAFDWIVERSGRKQFTIRYAYPIFSVISVLLGKIAPGITHDGTTDYSKFLYGMNIIGINQTLLITPKSNIVNAGYDQPAQSAPITLRSVLDMLRDCFRCYWFIDDNGKFRIEHIQYFRNGGSYSGLPVVGVDLTTLIFPRNGKQWAFARNQYKYEKPTMAARYQFDWMDDVTQLFAGYPIDIISKFVNPDNIEQITVSQFTSDLDYILLNPGAVSKDGFVLLASTTVAWAEQLANPLTYSWNGGAIQTSIDLTQYRGQTMRISLNTSRQYLSVSQTGGGSSQLIGEIVQEPNTIKTFEFVVDANAEYIILYGPQTGGAAISSLQLRIGEYVLPYENVIIDGNDHYLQNAWVAFCILQQYYAYDMPAPDYEINGVQMVAIGVKKLKTQNIQFPMFNDPNLFQLIKTFLGNGTVEKISVNLSSRTANATLRYDTE